MTTKEQNPTRLLLVTYVHDHKREQAVVSRLLRDLYRQKLAGRKEPVELTVAVVAYFPAEKRTLLHALKDHFHLRALSPNMSGPGEDNCLYLAEHDDSHVELRLAVKNHRTKPYLHKLSVRLYALRHSSLRGISADVVYCVMTESERMTPRALVEFDKEVFAPVRETPSSTALIVPQEFMGVRSQGPFFFERTIKGGLL